MKSVDVIIIGGGASGMMAAAKSAEKGASVILIEKMERLGRKVRITGKGRCNITNTKPWDEFSKHIFPKNIFFKSAFYHFSNVETINFFEKIGLQTKIERGERVYPASDQAKEVVEKLQIYLEKLNVEILLNTCVKDVIANEGKVKSVLCEKNGKTVELEAKSFIIATGGLSYPLTGSQGDGYVFAKNLGHTVTNCFPSLTALLPKDYNLDLIGLSLKNCGLKLIVSGNEIQNEFGDIDFTNNGVEGPLGLRVSRKAVKALINGEKVFVEIDLKSSLDTDKLVNRIKNDIKTSENDFSANFLRGYLPSQLINPILKNLEISSNTKIYNSDSLFPFKLANALKCWKMEIVGFTSYERAVITAGGIELSEIVSKNLKSKLYDNLFFAGELIDLDGDTGGYNLQIAFSTGSLAGVSAAHSVMTSGNSNPSIL